MKYEDICTRKSYTKDGAEKVIWLKCGTLRTTDDGKRFIELNHLPDVSFFVFEPKKKDTAPKDEGWKE